MFQTRVKLRISFKHEMYKHIKQHTSILWNTHCSICINDLKVGQREREREREKLFYKMFCTVKWTHANNAFKHKNFHNFFTKKNMK